MFMLQDDIGVPRRSRRHTRHNTRHTPPPYATNADTPLFTPLSNVLAIIYQQQCRQCHHFTKRTQTYATTTNYHYHYHVISCHTRTLKRRILYTTFYHITGEYAHCQSRIISFLSFDASLKIGREPGPPDHFYRNKLGRRPRRVSALQDVANAEIS